jgi:hypothetical protein
MRSSFCGVTEDKLPIFTILIPGFFNYRQVMYRFFCVSFKTKRMRKKKGMGKGREKYIYYFEEAGNLTVYI